MISVLYVDDEPGLLELARLFLEREGDFQVATSTSALGVLSDPAIRSYDAIIADYHMPEMDGIELLKTVRQDVGDVPFILFTGRGREEVVIEAINNGADFYVQKGGDPTAQFAELAHKVRQAVRRKRAEITLAEQKEHYLDLQNANDLIQSVTPDGRFRFVNAKWLDTLGYTAEDIPNLTIFDIIHEDSAEHCAETFRRVMDGENVGLIDAVFKTRDGRKVYVEGVVSCRTVDGRCQYTRGIFKDVTDRRLMEAALAESRDYLQQIYASIQSGIVVIDASTHEIVDLNPAAAEMIGVSRDQILGAICHQYFCPAECDRCPIADPHRGLDDAEQTLRTADGRLVTIIKHVVPVNLNGRECLLETFLDNTERKKALDELQAAYAKVAVAEEEIRENYDLLVEKEQALRESTGIFQAVVEQSGEGIVIVDLTGKLLYANPRAADIVESAGGLNPKNGINVLDFVAPEFRESATREFHRAAEGHDQILVRSRIFTHAGRTKWIECLGRAISLHGSPAMLLSLRDITERVQAEQELRDSEYKFATVFKSNPVPLILASASSGVFIDVNDAFLRGSGYTREEVIGKTAAEVGLFADGDENARFILMLREKGSVHGMELRCRDRVGEIRTCRFSSSIVPIGGVPHILTAVEDITDQKRAEEAMRESWERYRLILENANDGILVNELTPQGPGRLIDANESACRILGMTLEDLRGSNLADLDFPGIRVRAPGIVQVVLRDGHAVFQTPYRTRDNREKILDVSVNLFELNGKPTLLSVLRDITELRAAESALNALVASMVGATGIESLDRITESLSAWLGADCVMIGEITPDHERVRVLSMLLDGEKVPEYSYPLRGTPCEGAAKQGSCNYPVNASWLFPESHGARVSNIRGHAGTVLRNPEEEAVGLLCIFSRAPLDLPPSAREFIEIVAAKAAAEIGRMNALVALSESEEKFRTLVEHSLDGILILDPEGTILFANHAAGRLVDVDDPAGLIGKRNVMELITPASREDVIRDFENVAGGVDGYVARYQITTINQENRWIESLGKAIVFNGAPSILISLRDVTERQQAEEALQQANKKLNLLSSITRHDINNQLQILNGYLTLLQEKNTDPLFADMLSQAAAASRRIASMIQFTKEYEEVGVHLLVWQNLRLLVADAGRNARLDGVALVNEIADGVEVFADPLIADVFFNLIDNSLRHGERTTTIRFVSGICDGDCVVVCEDDGEGVLVDLKEKIFERGFGKNTGFGLFLSREVLGITGITIRETGEPGKGARFEITIPKGQYRGGSLSA